MDSWLIIIEACPVPEKVPWRVCVHPLSWPSNFPTAHRTHTHTHFLKQASPDHSTSTPVCSNQCCVTDTHRCVRAHACVTGRQCRHFINTFFRHASPLSNPSVCPVLSLPKCLPSCDAMKADSGFRIDLHTQTWITRLWWVPQSALSLHSLTPLTLFPLKLSYYISNFTQFGSLIKL